MSLNTRVLHPYCQEVRTNYALIMLPPPPHKMNSTQPEYYSQCEGKLAVALNRGSMRINCISQNYKPTMPTCMPAYYMEPTHTALVDLPTLQATNKCKP